jgi:hypothetical protein
LRKVPLKRVDPPEQAPPIINFCRGKVLESARAPVKAQVKSYTNDECTKPGSSIQV